MLDALRLRFFPRWVHPYARESVAELRAWREAFGYAMREFAPRPGRRSP